MPAKKPDVPLITERWTLNTLSLVTMVKSEPSPVSYIPHRISSEVLPPQYVIEIRIVEVKVLN